MNQLLLILLPFIASTIIAIITYAVSNKKKAITACISILVFATSFICILYFQTLAPQTETNEDVQLRHNDIVDGSISDSQKPNEPYEPEQFASPTPNDDSGENVDEPDVSTQTVTPFVTSSPAADTVTHADLANWTDDDRDIFDNNYTGANTMKLSVYNMINAMGGGADDITAEIHLPFGEKFNGILILNFVVMKDMVGNGSYANITILSENEALYPAFTLKSDTTDKLEYEVEVTGIRDLIIRFDCHAVGGGFCGGIIFTDKAE